MQDQEHPDDNLPLKEAEDELSIEYVVTDDGRLVKYVMRERDAGVYIDEDDWCSLSQAEMYIFRAMSTLDKQHFRELAQFILNDGGVHNLCRFLLILLDFADPVRAEGHRLTLELHTHGMVQVLQDVLGKLGISCQPGMAELQQIRATRMSIQYGLPVSEGIPDGWSLLDDLDHSGKQITKLSPADLDKDKGLIRGPEGSPYQPPLSG